MQIVQNRRTFLAGLSSAGGAGLIGTRHRPGRSRPRKRPPSVCPVDRRRLLLGGLYLAGELMRADGITDVRYVQGDNSVDNSVSGSHAARRISI